MAIRYSGDAEVRVSFNRQKQAFEGRVSDATSHWRGTLPQRHLGRARYPFDSEIYDTVAIYFLRQAHRRYPRLRFETHEGRVRIRRVFQAPCPKHPYRG